MSNRNISEKAKVLEWFSEAGCPYFAVHITKTDRVCWNDTLNDMEEATEKLSKFLDKGEPGKYTLYVYSKSKASTPTGTMKFYFEYSSAEKDEYFSNRNMSQMMLLEELRSLRNEVSELKTMKLMSESEDDEEVEEQAQPSSTIGAILGHPAVQQILTALLTNITANMVTPYINQNNQAPPRPMAMAGIPDEAESILIALEQKGISLSDLKLISELPQEKINWLLPMLRNGF